MTQQNTLRKTPKPQHHQESMVAGFQLRSPHRPARIEEPRTAAEVAEILTAARREGRRVAVQATGHGRSEGADDVVLISTRALTGISVDARNRTAWVAAGLTWGEVIAATTPFGLAPLSGSAPGVGVVGYTLAGGSGLLSRKYGYAADRVRSIEVVTPDGQIRRVDATGQDAELFWGLRGAGANLGVVTSINIELVAEPVVVGGSVAFDLGADPQVLSRWQSWVAEQRDDVLLAAGMLVYPDIDALPAQLRGRHIVQLQLCAPGPMTADIDAIRSGLRRLGSPLQDTITELPYARSGEVFADPDQPHAYRGSGWLLGRPAPEAFDSLAELAGASAGVMCVVGIRRLGGAMATSQPNAIGHRDADWSFNILSPEQPGQRGQILAAHERVLQPWRSSIIGRALNLTFQPLSAEQVAEGFDAENLPRLRRLRDLVDPGRILIANYAL